MYLRELSGLARPQLVGALHDGRHLYGGVGLVPESRQNLGDGRAYVDGRVGDTVDFRQGWVAFARGKRLRRVDWEVFGGTWRGGGGGGCFRDVEKLENDS